jgi:hypothetical protein
MHSQEDSGEVASPPVAQVVPIDAASSKHGRDRGQSPDAGGEGKARREKWIDWGKYNQLLQNFALIYGTDTVWDGGERMIMKIANMAHAHGSDVVKLWKASDARRTIRQDQVVFDPTGGCDPDQTVNLFDGIALQPLEDSSWFDSSRAGPAQIPTSAMKSCIGCCSGWRIHCSTWERSCAPPL